MTAPEPPGKEPGRALPLQRTRAALRLERKPIEFVGINDTFGSSAHSYQDIMEHLGLTAGHIAEAVSAVAAL